MEQGKLTLEQEFEIRSVEAIAKTLTQSQAQYALVDLYRQMVIKDTLYKGFLLQQLGV
jgi:Phycobilisome degradation protein nblA